MKYIIGIPYVNRPDLLEQAVRSIEPFWPHTVIIDNSESRDLCGHELASLVQIYEPPVPLTFTQSMNYIIRLAEDRNCDVWMYMHSDAEAHKGTPEAFLSIIETIELEGRQWGVLYTLYNTLAAYSMKAQKVIGCFDTVIRDYFADNDYYYRMKLAGFECINTPLRDKMTHHNNGSSSIKFDKNLALRNSITYPQAEIYYQLKWGGNPGNEKFKTPFNADEPLPSSQVTWNVHNVQFDQDLYHPELRNGPWVGHRYFGYDLIRFLKPRLVVELGTHFGTSFFTFAQAVRDENIESRCYAIDTWIGDKHAGFYGEEVYQQVSEMAGKFPNVVQLMRMTFDEALSHFEDESIDVVHIDGLHTYEAVTHDYYKWLPKLADKGIVLFHDISVKESDFGVYKLWSELKSKYPSLEFNHSHGLGVLFPKGYHVYFEDLFAKRVEIKSVYENKAKVFSLALDLGML